MKPHNIDLKKMGFYFITDSTLTKKGIEEDIREALRAGVKIIQYREKSKTAREMYSESLRIKKLCDGKALLIINDRVDIAMAADADGVHLGQEDMPCAAARFILGRKKIIGVTAHDAEEAADAEKKGADYIGASPVFATDTKKDAGPHAGLELIREIRKKVRIPIVAIGGINLANIVSVMKAGADGACAISAVIAEGKTFEECKKFIQITEELKENN
ncbi:MAG TPA: thiamine phosphate synthase [bacterium]|nr:thiamine phosphate synthase [bacterium]